MAHPQSSPRGLWSKGAMYVGTHLVTANSTAVIIRDGLAIGTYTGAYITANSTGIKLGARYISTNTTGNTST